MLLLPVIRNLNMPSDFPQQCNFNARSLVKPSHGSKVKPVDKDSVLISESLQLHFKGKK